MFYMNISALKNLNELKRIVDPQIEIQHLGNQTILTPGKGISHSLKEKISVEESGIELESYSHIGFQLDFETLKMILIENDSPHPKGVFVGSPECLASEASQALWDNE